MDAQEAWDKLGEDGRALLRANIMSLFSMYGGYPGRYRSGIKTVDDLSSMKAAAHPIERIAGAHGCMCGPCRGYVFELSQKRAWVTVMSSGEHAATLVKIFLTDPALTYPADIPRYALRVLPWARTTLKSIVREMKRKAVFDAKTQAREAAKVARVARTLDRLRQREALRNSYAYRIVRAKEKAEGVSREIESTQRRLAHLQKKKARAYRSVAALTRAAQKKGEKTK